VAPSAAARVPTACTPIWTKDISLVEPAITTKTCRFASSSGAGASLLMARCRSTFRDWVAERTNHPREVAEVALAHIVANATERSYQRGDLFDKRRTLMDS